MHVGYKSWGGVGSGWGVKKVRSNSMNEEDHRKRKFAKGQNQAISISLFGPLNIGKF